MSFPSVGGMSEEEKAKIRAEFTDIMAEPDIDTSHVPTYDEQAAPKRGRGRPPGSKNKPRPGDYEPHYVNPEDRPILATPPLTTRDQKEVAKRLAGILEGLTGVASVAKPYFQMTPEEAEAIATPLSTYLIRSEPTSGVAKQILEEYDVAAFIIALAAYAVRVYLDFNAERDDIKRERAERQPPVRDVTPVNPGVESIVGTPESEDSEIIRRTGLQSQESAGETWPTRTGDISTAESGWRPSGL